MEQDMELLNYIYQNAKMGESTIGQLVKTIEDTKFKKVIERERKEYQKLEKMAKKLMEKEGATKKEKSILSKVTTYIMIKMNTANDKSTNHLAEMMMKGSNMGIIDISKNINRLTDVSEEVKELATDLLEMEQMNVEELKPYL